MRISSYIYAPFCITKYNKKIYRDDSLRVAKIKSVLETNKQTYKIQKHTKNAKNI